MDGGKDEDLVMGAELALHGNAHRMRELAEVLLQKPSTMAELAAAIGVSVNDVEHILARLRKNGLPVAIVEDLDPEPRYRIVYPKGRVCAAEGCGTLLRRSNPSDRCERHGGGVLQLHTGPRRQGPAPSTPTATQPSPSRVAFDGPAFRAARERRRLSLRQVGALAKVHFTNLARFERGTRRPTADVAARLEAALEEAPIYVDVSWREVRRRADLSLCEVARRAGIHRTVLSRVERGERQATRDVAQRLVETPGTSVMRR